MAVPALLALALAGCAGDANAPATGTLRINLIDSPAAYDAVYVQIDSVQVHEAGADSSGGWRTVSAQSGTYDLLTLRNGLSALLVDRQLPAGQYTQIRLRLGDGNRVVVDGVEHDLDVPSGAQSGLKLNHPFTVDGGVLTEITLDFDASRSVHRTGNGQYKLRPVIRAMANVVSGSLRGAVLPVDARATVEAVSGVDTLVAWADTLNGSFLFPVIREGLWQVTIAPTAGAFLDSVLAAVPVAAQQATDLGSIELAPLAP
jgi:hypothetical protein